MGRLRTRIARLIGGLALLAGATAPLAVVEAAPASAALPPSPGCAFHFGAITPSGAAGTLVFIVPLVPNSPVQNCTLSLTATVRLARTSGTPNYTNITNDPLTETTSVTFTPGRLPPVLAVAWSPHCADPVAPGTLTITAAGHQAAVAVTPDTCAGFAANSTLRAAPEVHADSTVGIAATPTNTGYWTVDQLGNVYAFGTAAAGVVLGSSSAPLVGVTAAPHTSGFWAVAANGTVLASGAPFFGDAHTLHLNAPIVAIAATPSGHGYWLVASDGGVFSYGDAAFHGSTGGIHLNAPVVAIAAAPDGNGYWLAAYDGGVFAFGSAGFHGSMGSIVLNAPVVGIASNAHGGYWMVASDGGIFAFGGATFHGSMGGTPLNAPVSSMAATSDGAGYWLLGADNGIFAFGDAHFFGSGPFTS